MARVGRVIGAGRAGRSFAEALERAGWEIAGLLGRADDVSGAAEGVDLLLLTPPDASISAVAAAIEPVATTVVAHAAGSLGLAVLSGHERAAAIHPLVSLPNPTIGASRLRGAWFAVAGDPLVDEVVRDLGGRSFPVADAQRALYHAAACIASNHLVALLGQVERVAAAAGVPLAAYLELSRGTLENVAELGPGPALTGPAARGDAVTIEHHLAALDPGERRAYEALADLARRLAAKTAQT